MYRENYGRQTAATMYLAQKPTAEVQQMLVAEGATPEQAEELAQTYYKQHLFRLYQAAKKKVETSRMYQLSGMVLIAASIFLSFVSYVMIDYQGSFIAFYGLAIWGVIALVKGTLDRRNAEQALEQA